MKKLSIALTAAAGMLAAPAMAADLRMPVKAPAAYAPAAMYNWSGFYIGAQGGGKFGDVGNSFTIGGVTTPEPDYRATGWVAGGHVGYNFHTGMFLLGIEGDAEYADIDGDDGGRSGVVDRFRGRWEASIRGRLGLTAGPALFYVTGGWAWLGTDYSLISAATTLTNRNTLDGWTVGAGIEFAFAPNWSGRVEYRYADFDPISTAFAGGGGILPQTITYDYQQHAVRVGVSYRFGGGGPIAASY